MDKNLIDKNTLKPGDIVYVQREVRVGWTSFRYPLTVPKKIDRITPARTKYIMDDGEVYSRHASFYGETKEDAQRNIVVVNMLKITELARKLYGLDVSALDDETILKAGALAEQVCKMLEKGAEK